MRFIRRDEKLVRTATGFDNVCFFSGFANHSGLIYNYSHFILRYVSDSPPFYLVTIDGELPAIGSRCTGFFTCHHELKEVGLREFAGKTIVLNVFPSIDTPVCASSVRQFNAGQRRLENVIVLAIAKDLPLPCALLRRRRN